jgi:hypothetical protein
VIPAGSSRIIVEADLEAAEQWARRHQVDLAWFPEKLQLNAKLTQRATTEAFYLRGQFDDFRALPPAWTFTASDFASGVDEYRYFPKPGEGRFGASIFIDHGGHAVICTPFNRLAYAQYRGPHSNWPDASKWMDAGDKESVRAHTVPDMLQVIFRDFNLSCGRMR